MRILAIDGRVGASGDMLLGALIDAGADPAVLAPVTDALSVEYEIETVVETGIEASRVQVVRTDDPDGSSDDGDTSADTESTVHGDDHTHDDADGHAHDHGDDHAHADTPAEGHGPSRRYSAVLDIVDSMDLPAGVRSRATAVFDRLATAEAAVHGTDPAETHFHEVGADDAIADIVGVTLLLDDLDVDRIVTTPLAAGGGEVTFSHGTYPVPVPAVVELAVDADWSLRGGPVETELLTPTGAALLAEFADGVESLPPLSVSTMGYGAGQKSLADRPNVLRVLVGDGRGSLTREEIRVLETNLDDASPELLGGLQETLAEVGARDVSIVPLTMKKSRPGHLVKVVVKPEDVERVARRLATETGSLGVREAAVSHRWIADRTVETVSIEIDGDAYEVAVKVGRDDAGSVFDISAEYDDAAAVAETTDRPIKWVMGVAEAAYRRSD
ncbi:MAG: nickel pincer cofactor biosynthesis protein LarC [Halobacteriales archaeon]